MQGLVPALAVDAVGVAVALALQAQAARPDLLVAFLEAQIGVLLLFREIRGRGREFTQLAALLDLEFDALAVDVQVSVAGPGIGLGFRRSAVVVARIRALGFPWRDRGPAELAGGLEERVGEQQCSLERVGGDVEVEDRARRLAALEFELCAAGVLVVSGCALDDRERARKIGRGRDGDGGEVSVVDREFVGGAIGIEGNRGFGCRRAVGVAVGDVTGPRAAWAIGERR